MVSQGTSQFILRVFRTTLAVLTSCVVPSYAGTVLCRLPHLENLRFLRSILLDWGGDRWRRPTWDKASRICSSPVQTLKRKIHQKIRGVLYQYVRKSRIVRVVMGRLGCIAPNQDTWRGRRGREGGRDRRRIKIEDPGHGNPTQTYIIEIVNVIAIVNCLVNNKPGPMSCCSFDAMETALLCILDLLAVCPSVAPHEEERFTHAIKPTKPSGFWNVLAG